MATYEGSCYEILSNVRRALNEGDTDYITGTDTSGIFENAFIMDQINDSQKHLYMILMKVIPEAFLTSVSLTGSDSVFTLPANYGKVLEFRDENGSRVYRAGSRAVPAPRSGASKKQYYQEGNTFVVFQSGVTSTYTLWYYKKPREIHAGLASAGGALSITLDSTYAKLLADYYNGMLFENVTDDSVDTISDYSSARVATITGTGATSDYYGIVSEIPEYAWHLIAPRAAMLCKERHPASQEKPGPLEVMVWEESVKDTISALGIVADITPEEIWTDFGGSPGGTVNIPGQGYLI